MGQNLARSPQPKRSQTFFMTLTNRLRVRSPASRHTLSCIHDEPEHAKIQSSLHRRTSRAQAVPIALPNDIASRERRAEALRSRGLLPPKSQDLSAIEAEEDRHIDTDQVHDLELTDPDNVHSDAKQIAQSWRSSNPTCLSLSRRTAEALVDSMPEGSWARGCAHKPTDLIDSLHLVISPIDMSDDDLELLTKEVDFSAPSPRTSLPEPLPSDRPRSPVSSLRAASPTVSNDKQDAIPSREASLKLPSLETLTIPLQQSVPVPTSPYSDSPVGSPQTEKAGDADISFLSTPSLLALPESSFLHQSSIHEESQVLLTSSSQRSVSPSGSEDVPTPRFPRFPPSPRSVSSPRPAPSSPHPPSPDLSASSVPNASPLYLHPVESDTLTASPTSPTVPSLLCSSSSEMSHSTVITDNGETLASPTSHPMSVNGRRANISPVAVMSGEGGFLCEEVIVETTESFPEDDLDPFAGPQSTTPVNLKDDVSATSLRRRKSRPFLGMGKKRASTLGTSSTAGILKSASMVNLRRSMSNAFQARARPLSIFSNVGVPPQSRTPPPSPLNVTMHNGASILAQASLIADDETRRLSELAFM